MAEARGTIQTLKFELDTAHKKLQKQEASKKQFQSDLQVRQQFLIKAKGEQIKMLTDQLEALQEKLTAAERAHGSSKNLMKQHAELQSASMAKDKQIREMQQQLRDTEKFLPHKTLQQKLSHLKQR